jgi:hypothetical protein
MLSPITNNFRSDGGANPREADAIFCRIDSKSPVFTPVPFVYARPTSIQQPNAIHVA